MIVRIFVNDAPVPGKPLQEIRSKLEWRLSKEKFQEIPIRHGQTREPLPKGKLCTGTVDLLILCGFDQLVFILKILFIFVTKQATSIWRLDILSFPV
jgi:hypothetical protein